MSGALRRGLLAGALGTVALDVATYLDMAVRGRPASTVPEQTVEAGLDAAGIDLAGGRGDRANRLTALGALAGMATGVTTGVGVSVARSRGLRFSPLTGAVLTGAAAMAAADVPAALLGVSDPRTWSESDWRSDVVPHLVFGAVTHQAVLREERAESVPRPNRPSAGLLARSLVLGVATGCRSSLGLLGAVRSRPGRLLVLGAVGVELVADKAPATPSRLEGAGVASRLGGATVGAIGLAAREDAGTDLPVLAAGVGAAVGGIVGAAWREAASGRIPDGVAAGLEDAVAVGLASLVVRGR